ncbi:MAG: hypothetical protein Q4E58_08125 [Prevotellaceae bacterium]|nr:hypothetical protein [Prevotellaceae bacterium]
MKKLLMTLAVATVTFAATAYPTENRVEKSEVNAIQQDPKGDAPIIESINNDWIKVSYPDIGFSFEAPAGLVVSKDFGRFSLSGKGMNVEIVYHTSSSLTPETAKEFLTTSMESTKKFTEESKTEIKGATATSWEHKNGMQHHTRYIVGNHRYVRLRFYYWDDKKDTYDKPAKRVLKSMKLEDK